MAHDVALAEDEAERRMTSVVFSAAAGGDVKAAMFWLERRRPADYRLHTAATVDGRLAMEQEYPAEVLALARRYAALSPEETESEIKRLAWVVPGDEQPGVVIAHQPGGEGEERTPNGGEAMPLLALAQPAAAQAPDVSPDSAHAAHQPNRAATSRLGPTQPAEALPPLEWHPGPEPIRCIHCQGTHEAACPHAAEGTFRIDPGDLRGLLGDPR